MVVASSVGSAATLRFPQTLPLSVLVASVGIWVFLPTVRKWLPNAMEARCEALIHHSQLSDEDFVLYAKLRIAMAD
jgi:hypothetical protein